MVDMFTVLTIFLLQNYNSTGKVIDIPKEVILPQASAHKELDPALVINITKDFIALGRQTIMPTTAIAANSDWLLPPLLEAFRSQILQYQERQSEGRLKKLADQTRNQFAGPEKVIITLQADKAVAFSIIKKVMYTLTEAGADEINFAVLQKPSVAK
jgi:biopolymer transport protein ExbD